MYAYTHIYIYTYISQHVDPPNINALCMGGGTRWVNVAYNRMPSPARLRAATNESKKTLNKCETRNKTVFHTRLRHPETINSVPLNSVLRIKQIGV